MIELARQEKLPPDPVAWLYQAVRFRAINLHRSEQRRSKREHEVASMQVPFFVSEPQQAIDSADLEKALKSVPELQRSIVIARIWGGLTFEQIAEMNELSSSTVHRRYHEAIEELKQTLEGVPCERFSND